MKSCIGSNTNSLKNKPQIIKKVCTSNANARAISPKTERLVAENRTEFNKKTLIEEKKAKIIPYWNSFHYNPHHTSNSIVRNWSFLYSKIITNIWELYNYTHMKK